jgi:manganese/zinc/iron transport system substrate-binding protein
MARADLVLWHGLYLEAQLEDFLRDLASDRRVVAVGEALPRDRLIAHADYGQVRSACLDGPDAVGQRGRSGARCAVEADPDAAATFAANAEALS